MLIMDEKAKNWWCLVTNIYATAFNDIYKVAMKYDANDIDNIWVFCSIMVSQDTKIIKKSANRRRRISLCDKITGALVNCLWH